MPIERYRRVFAVPALRHALLLGLLVRMPIFTGSVILTIHVVATLHRSYGAAGLLSGAATVAIAVSGPWRGRLLDRLGLRRVVVPSIVVAAVCWSIAPFVAYWPLLALAALAGLFVIPSFSIIRQAVVAAVPDEDRRTALSLDASMVELSFMIGPAAGVWAATRWSTSWVLFGVEMLGVAAGILLWVANPPLYEASGDEEGSDAPARGLPRSAWFRGRFLAVCTAAAATTVVLGGLHRSVPSFALLGALAVVTVPMALAAGVASLALLSFVAGLLCAPTITATVDEVSRVVPSAARGEAMGWHGSFMTAGMALGAPGAGVAIDAFGYAGGFVAVSLVGLAVAVVGAVVIRRRGDEPGLVAAEATPAPAELLG